MVTNDVRLLYSFKIRLKSERIQYWLGVGAQPSERVAKILGMAGMIPEPLQRQPKIKCVPKKDRKQAFSTATIGVVGGLNPIFSFRPIALPANLTFSWKSM